MRAATPGAIEGTPSGHSEADYGRLLACWIEFALSRRVLKAEHLLKTPRGIDLTSIAHQCLTNGARNANSSDRGS
jgi:hypothetical protein